MAMAVMNAQYKFPRDSPYSEGFKALISACLQTNPAERPSIEELINMAESLLRSVQ